MSNENTTASEMQHPELDIVDRLLTKPPLYTLTNMDLCKAAQEILDLRESLKSAHAVATAFATKIQELEAENKELHEMVDDLTDNFGYDPHAEAWAARAEEEKKWQEEYRKRHEERMARIAATRKNAEGKNNPPF
jgi:peptidoglycan hydrolase CwlO-like protein